MIRTILTPLAILVAAAIGIVGYTWIKYLRLHGDIEYVSFASADGVVLYGRLITPDAPGPHPAILLLHGSGPASGLPPFATGHANTFLDRGIAVFTYDKRGSGKSGGDFDTATFADFIDDAVAAVTAMRAREEIIVDKVALFGTSESGWLTPEIAQRVGGIAFIINRAGPPLSWVKTNLWEIRNELIAAGIEDQAEIAAFLDLRERIWRYYEAAATARDPLPEMRATLAADLEGIDPKWIEATGMRLADYDLEKFERWLVDILYDPSPYWESLAVPVLSLHGGDDQNVPTADAVAAYKGFRNAYGVDVEWIVYPGYRHGMGKFRNVFSMGYPPDYLPTVGRWARDRSYREASQRPHAPQP